MTLTPKCPGCLRALGHERGCILATGPDSLRTEPGFATAIGAVADSLPADEDFLYQSVRGQVVRRMVSEDRVEHARREERERVLREVRNFLESENRRVGLTATTMGGFGDLEARLREESHG